MIIGLLTFVATLLALIIWDPLKFRQNPQTPLARVIAWIRQRIVDDCRDFWRWWSVRFNAAGLAILGLVSFDPVSALAIWNMMPPHVRAFLPPNFLTIVGMALFVLSMLARLVKQKPKATTNG